MGNDHDVSGRRKRIRPVSTGKRVTPQSRDMQWFQNLAEHGPLPSSFLLQYAKESHRSEKRARERLTDLFNEDNTPHGGAYLARPVQQFRTLDSRYNQLVYDLTPASHKALKDADLTLARQRRHSGPWLHGFMVSCITASIELATRMRSDMAYIPQSALLARAGADLRYPVSIAGTATGNEIKKDLIPDALFGLEYKTLQGSRFRTFLVEADRSTEPATSRNFNRKSWQRNLLQYEIYIGKGLYRDHLKLKSPLLVLNVVTSAKRLTQILRLVPTYAPIAGSHLLFQTWEEFGPVFSPPKPNADLLEGLWERAVDAAFLIDRV
ncbi:MAG: hypothetical protein GXP05_00945 [Alphaproteobacteria bacterium]|nr:hypothetical protein [Alphaproteobacteria bacterium]